MNDPKNPSNFICGNLMLKTDENVYDNPEHAFSMHPP
jgi:hypothetical protein